MICCLQETHFKYIAIGRQKIKGWKKIYHMNIKQRKAGVTILTSDKVDFRAKKNYQTVKDIM